MWIIIVLVVIGIIAKFIYDKNKVKANVAKQGGMLHKYKRLIAHLKGENPEVKILKVSNDIVELGICNVSGVTVFSIVQSFKKVVVRWNVKSMVMGNHNLEWSFNEFKNQDEIAKVIHNELEIYQENVLNNQALNNIQ